MANTATTSAAAKKKQDERNSKIIRELANLPDNRFCFECGQRGPTYVNITEGSFCCSTCSGLLRGLNPPHRVKSISMATFSNEELEKIRTLGNAENKKTWLGLYEGAAPKFATRDERQTFLIKKYEKKAWFVSRSELNEQERLFTAARERSSQCSTSVTSETSSQQTNDLLNDPFSDAFAFTQTQATNMSVPLSPPSQLAPPPPLFSTSPSNSFPMPTTTTPKTKQSLPIVNAQVSAFVDPFSPIETQKPITSTNPPDPFADFDSLFGGLSVQKLPAAQMPRSQTVGGVPPRPAQVPVLQQQPIVSQTRPDPTPPMPISQPSAIFSSGSPAATAPVNGHQHQQQPQQQQPQQQQPQQQHWSSSAYGSKPTNGGNPFGQASPVVAPIQQPNPAQAWPNPFQAVNPFGPTNGQVNPFGSQIQKSSTVGAFGDLSSMNQQFSHQQQHFANNFQHSTGFVEVNPFAAAFFTPQNPAMQPNTSHTSWNPFS